MQVGRATKFAIGFVWALALAPFASLAITALGYRFFGLSFGTAMNLVSIGTFGLLPISALAVLGSPLLYYGLRRSIALHRRSAILAWAVLSLTTTTQVALVIIGFRGMMQSARSNYVQDFLLNNFTLDLSMKGGPPYRRGYGPWIDVSNRQISTPVVHVGGWLLMRPPLTPDSFSPDAMWPNPDTPLTAWAKLGNFETEHDCRQDLEMTLEMRLSEWRAARSRIPGTWQSREKAEANRRVERDFYWVDESMCVPADATPQPAYPWPRY